MNKPVRLALAYVEVPFQVYAVYSGDTYYAAGSRYRPMGSTVVVTEIDRTHQHTLKGITDTGDTIIFGGPPAKHWIVQDITVPAPDYPDPPIPRQRPSTQGDNHYSRKVPPEIRRTTEELRAVTRSLTLLHEKLRRIQQDIDSKTRKQSELRKQLADHKGKS